MLLWEDWGAPGSRTPPAPGELPVLDELATLTGQPSPPLAGLRLAYRRPEFVVPDTVTSYSPARAYVPAVVERQRGGPGSQLTGALARLAAARPGGIARSGVAAVPSRPGLTLGTRRASATTWLLPMAQLRWQSHRMLQSVS